MIKKTLLTGTLILATNSSFADDHNNKQKPAPTQDCFKMAITHTPLSNQQQVAIKSIVQEAHSDINTHIPKVKAQHKKLMASLSQYPIDENIANKKWNILARSIKPIHEIGFDTRIAIINTLSTQQRHNFNKYYGHCEQNKKKILGHKLLDSISDLNL